MQKKEINAENLNNILVSQEELVNNEEVTQTEISASEKLNLNIKTN